MFGGSPNLHAKSVGMWVLLISDPIRVISPHILTSEILMYRTSTDFSGQSLVIAKKT